MPSLSNWLTILSAISTPLLAAANDVIDTHAASALVRYEDNFGESGNSDAITANDVFDGGMGLLEHTHSRSLLRRQRGTSRASPRFRKKPPPKKKKSKKKSSPKKKKSKKKSSSKRKSKKKSSPKKKSKKKSSPKKKSKKMSSSKRKSKKKSPPKKKTSKKSAPRKPSKRSSGGGGKMKTGHGTHFAGMGKPTGGCGVPPGKAYDDNGKALPYVALNWNSEFSSGKNCGRWVEITLGTNCQGAGNSLWSICNGGKWVSDKMTGDKIYGYTMDSCDDKNFWCQNDPYHLDISRPYLSGMGMVGHQWNGREIHWKYMTSTPPGYKMSQPKFMWKKGTKWIKNGKGFYATVIIYNVDNGISRVQQKVGSKWVSIGPLQHLGNMWVLQKPPDSEYRSASGGSGKSITLRVVDKSGKSYGDYKLAWGCGGTGACSKEVDAKSKKVG